MDGESEMGWHVCVEASGVSEDEPHALTIGNNEIAICNVNGSFFAIDNICSHAYALLSDGWVEGFEIICPLHQARFDIRSGEALTSPAQHAVRCYQTRICDGVIEVLIGA